MQKGLEPLLLLTILFQIAHNSRDILGAFLLIFWLIRVPNHKNIMQKRPCQSRWIFLRSFLDCLSLQDHTFQPTIKQVSSENAVSRDAYSSEARATLISSYLTLSDFGESLPRMMPRALSGVRRQMSRFFPGDDRPDPGPGWVPAG